MKQLQVNYDLDLEWITTDKFAVKSHHPKAQKEVPAGTGIGIENDSKIHQGAATIKQHNNRREPSQYAATEKSKKHFAKLRTKYQFAVWENKVLVIREMEP